MDFYEALAQYEEKFGELITNNLFQFEKELKEISLKDNYHKNYSEKINNNSILEIINEIKNSKNLMHLLHTKYNLYKNKYIIYAKDVLKKKNINNFNQKGIINYNITPIILNKDIIKDEIKEKIKKEIKEKFIIELEKQIEIEKNYMNNCNLNNLNYLQKINKSHSLTESDINENDDSNLMMKRLHKEKFENKNKNNNPKKSLSLLNDNILNHNYEIMKKNNNLFYYDNDNKNNRLNTDINKSKDNIFNNKGNNIIIFTENKNKEKIKKIHIKNIKLNNVKNNTEKDQLNEEPKQENKKKITIIKFKIGNNNKENEHEKEIRKAKTKIKEKVKINFKGKRILSSKMTIKNDK